MPTKLFKSNPPYEFFQQIMVSTKLSYHKWFSKEEICLEGIEAWLPELEAYYVQCKAKRFLHDGFDKSRCITVLRHLAPLFDCDLQSQEKVHNGKKGTLYCIKPHGHQDISGTGEVIVDFT